MSLKQNFQIFSILLIFSTTFANQHSRILTRSNKQEQLRQPNLDYRRRLGRECVQEWERGLKSTHSHALRGSLDCLNWKTAALVSTLLLISQMPTASADNNQNCKFRCHMQQVNGRWAKQCGVVCQYDL